MGFVGLGLVVVAVGSGELVGMGIPVGIGGPSLQLTNHRVDRNTTSTNILICREAANSSYFSTL